MKFAVLGGDERSARLCRRLYADGHRVSCFALEGAELSAEIPKTGCLQGCVYGADCVVLPIPCEQGGLLNAPLSSETPSMDSVIAALWQGQLLVGGRLSEGIVRAAVRAGVAVEDIMQRRSYCVGNAAVTAEGAIERMMAESARTLWRGRVLVTGWGRIAKILSLRLRSLGAAVTVAARKEGDRAMAAALGMDSVEISELEPELPRFDFIVNTVPARIFSDSMLCCIREDALLLELASAPGGFDMTLAANIGLHACAAPGLPGKCAPETAAELMQRAIYAAISEQRE